MMGSKQRVFAPIVAVSLDHLVPANHFYRRLDRVLDLAFVRDFVTDRYAPRGRPSVDPVVFFKLQLVMLFEGLRSERQLLALAADRLSVRCRCPLGSIGYDLTEPLPDHSSLTRIRDRYGLDAFRRFFDAVVGRCVAAGLVWGGELYFDATKVVANAAAASVQPRFAVEAHLAALFAPDGPEVVPGDSGEAEATDPPELPPPPHTSVALPRVLPAEEYHALAVANAERHDWYAKEGHQQRAVTHGEYRRVADFKVSGTDPDASLLPSPSRKEAHPGYHAHYVVDGGKARIVLAALVTPSEVMENQPMLDLLWRTRFRWHLWPRQVTGDTTDGTIENLREIETAGIRTYIPVRDANKRAPLFGLDAFTYDPDTDTYRCPNGETLRVVTRSYTERIARYEAPKRACHACPLRAQCTTGKGGRQVQRTFDTEYLDRVRGYYPTEAYQKALRKRKVWVEPLFAEAKAWHGLRRFRLRGLGKVNSEALLVASVQNLKRLLAQRRRSSPPGAGGAGAPGALAVALHFAFGAGVGALFGVLHAQLPARVRRHPALSGAAYATLVWAVSYQGWVPALGILPPATRDAPGRPATMLLAHWVYGATLGVVVARRGHDGK